MKISNNTHHIDMCLSCRYNRYAKCNIYKDETCRESVHKITKR